MPGSLLRAEKNHGLSLPNELALLIVEQIALADDRPLLCALARTCRGLQELAEERLYRDLNLVSVDSLHAIVNALHIRPARRRAVQSLRILYQYKPSDLCQNESARRLFNQLIFQMVNLRTWHIESPYDNFHWGTAGGEVWVNEDMQAFCRALESACTQGAIESDRITSASRLRKSLERTVSLALLQDLTIHSHGVAVDFWPLGTFHCLFRHPALRTLHVSCIAFPADEIPELASHVRKSPLTTLVFDECELTPKSLLSVLRTPMRLKHLTLGENVFNVNRTRSLNPILTSHAAASLEALSTVAHSLESLTHLDPTWRTGRSPHVLHTIRPTGTGMRNFHSLTHLECDTTSFLHRAIIMNRDFAPPNLETLRLRRHWEVDADFWDQLPPVDPYLALPSLTTLECMQSSFLWHGQAQSGYICDAERLRIRHAKAYQLYKAGINLQMLIEMHRDPDLIPPYLQGERVPIVDCLYDASEVGFRRHITKGLPEAPRFATNSPKMDETTAQIEHEQDSAFSSVGVPLPSSSTTTHYALAASPSRAVVKEETPNEDPAPETDQLDDVDIERIRLETRRLLNTLKRQFMSRKLCRNLDSGAEGSLSSGDEDWELMIDDEFDLDDLSEEEDMELDLELDDDGELSLSENQIIQLLGHTEDHVEYDEDDEEPDYPWDDEEPDYTWDDDYDNGVSQLH